MLPADQREPQLDSIREAPSLAQSGLFPAFFNTCAEQMRAVKKTPGRYRRDMQVMYGSIADQAPTLCLAVFVSGEPYAEDKEQRLRVRYAVESALAESDYHLSYARRLSYVVPKIFVRGSGGWEEREIVLPLKFYQSNDGESDGLAQDSGVEAAPAVRPQVLVLWINETELGELPLLATHRLLHAVFCRIKTANQDKFKVAIIGPTNSDVLQKMADECAAIEGNTGEGREDWMVSSYRPLGLQLGFSPLWRSMPRSEQQDYESIQVFSPYATADIEPAFSSRFFTLHPVIGKDSQLVEKLRDELETRGALDGTVVLVSGNDTQYGRGFDSVFKGQARDIVRVGALRGIDGKLPGDDSDQKKAGAPPKAETAGDMFSGPIQDEQSSVGRSQYDYLRRLAEQIRNPRNGSIRAIGVVGTDVYDKLLVLRALRPQFPEAVFFTTDMDAIYVDPKELPTTRNLIIASHFGLSLRKTLQGKTPPFRDSYQTSTFLATRLALFDGLRRFDPSFVDSANRSHQLMDQWFKKYGQGRQPLPTVRFVVGRTRARELPETPPQESNAHLLAPLLAPLAAATSATASESEGIESQIRDEIPGNDNWHLVSVVCATLILVLVAWLTTQHSHVADWLNRLDEDDDGNGSKNVAPRDGNGNGEQPKSWILLAGRSVPVVLILEFVAISSLLTLAIRATTWKTVAIALPICIATLSPSWLLFRYRARHQTRRTDRQEATEPSPRHWPPRRPVATVLGMSIAVGVLLLFVAILAPAWDIVSPLGAYNAWPRTILYALAGIFATFSLGWLLIRLRTQLHSAVNNPDDPVNESLGQEALASVQGRQLLQCVFLGVVVVYTGVLFIYGPYSLHSLLFAGFAGGLFACVYVTQNSYPSHGTFLDLTPVETILWALSAMGIVTLVMWPSGLATGPLPGWYGVSTSRYLATRIVDRIAEAYAFGMVGLLLGSMLYLHLWCRVFGAIAAKGDKEKWRVFGASDRQGSSTLDAGNPETNRVSSSDVSGPFADEHGALWLVGKVTIATNQLLPALMGLLLVLVLAYHPLVSPSASPMGLLLTTTLGLAAFVASAVWLRWHFDRERQRLVLKIEKELSSLAQAESDEADQDDSAGEILPPVRNYKTRERETAVATRESPRTVSRQKRLLQSRKQQVESLSEGVFQPWNQAPLGWLLGGSTLLALVDWWIRAFTIAS
jgi:hypothetical protein